MNSQISNLLLWAFVAALAVVFIQSTSAEESSRLKRIFCNFEGCGNRKRSEENPLLERVFNKLEEKRNHYDIDSTNLSSDKINPNLVLQQASLWDAFLEKMRSRRSQIRKRHAPVNQ